MTDGPRRPPNVYPAIISGIDAIARESQAHRLLVDLDEPQRAIRPIPNYATSRDARIASPSLVEAGLFERLREQARQNLIERQEREVRDRARLSEILNTGRREQDPVPSWPMLERSEPTLVNRQQLLIDADYAELERRTLALMEQAGVPAAFIQGETPQARREIDAVWPDRVPPQRHPPQPPRISGPTQLVHDEIVVGIDWGTPTEEAAECLTLSEGEELEVVSRTTTRRTTRRRTPGRKVVDAPTENQPIYIWGMESSKPRNGGQFVTYEVRLNEDGSVSCNCPGWIFKKKTDDRGCKHTRHVEDQAKDFYRRHKRGEQLPVEEPTEEQLARFGVGRSAKKDDSIRFGRVIQFD